MRVPLRGLQFPGEGVSQLCLLFVKFLISSVQGFHGNWVWEDYRKKQQQRESPSLEKGKGGERWWDEEEYKSCVHVHIGMRLFPFYTNLPRVCVCVCAHLLSFWTSIS